MSGIAGIYNINGLPVDPAVLHRMIDAIAHRGPDGVRHWIDGPVGLGHCMLHTTPESVYERQPLTDESNNLCLTMDGRVDNREDLLAALKSAGARLRDDTDAELVLRAYECWGTECPAKIIGDFAFVIWDKRHRQLFCARDILGIKPFYYHSDGRKFLWASELHQLFRDPAVPREPNEEMVAEYLAANLTDREGTLYKGILRLAPAHSLLIREGRIDKRAYWDLNPGKEVRHRTDEEYADHFSSIFKEAVRCRLRSQGPVGAELSGGLDSSSVVGMSQALYREGLAPDHGFATLSLVYPGRSCDESSYINDAVDMWKVESHKLHQEAVSPSAYFEDARRYEDFPDYPNGVISNPVSVLSRRNGLRVVLTGGGGDEWLTGSFYHYADFLRRFKILTLVRQLRCDRQFGRTSVGVPAIVFPRRALLRVGFFPLLPPLARRGVKWALRRGYVPPPWIDPQFAHRARLRERQSEPVHKKFPTFAQEDMYGNLIDGWACQGYEIGNRSESRYGFERRHPLSDRRVIEFAFALPEEQRWRGQEPKFILRNAMRGLLPETIRRRLTKADFSQVFPEALEAIGGENFFNSLTIASMGWVDGNRASGLYREMIQNYKQSNGGLIAHTWQLWMICGIELWFRAVFLGADHASSEILPGCEIQPV